MTRPSVSFGTAVQGDANEALRRRVAQLAASRPGAPLHVDTLLAAAGRLAKAAANGAAPPAAYLLLDLHRVFYYEEPADIETGVGISSVVRSIVDAYPFQPFELLAREFEDGTHPFLYDPAVLDVLGSIWRVPAPGAVTTLNLATGEIARAAARVHPDAHPLCRVDAATATRPERMELNERWTDASLRAGTQADLDGLVSRELGPVRECADYTNHASLPWSTARVTWDHGRRGDTSGGKSIRGGDARFVAVCEALERFQVAFQRHEGEVLVRGSRTELGPAAIDPRSLFIDAGGYHDGAVLHWTWASDPGGQAPVLVPAQDIWFNAAKTLGEPYYVRASTNGCALGGSVEEAAVFALFEAVERDAFLTSWYLRRRCTRIDPDSVRDEGFQLLRRRWHMAYPGYALFLFDVTNDVAVPAVMAIAVRERGDGPRVFTSAAARLRGEQACFTALKDLTGFKPGMTPERFAELQQLLYEPERIEGPAQHFELYALDETFDRLGFLDFGPLAPLDVREISARALIGPAERYDLRAVLARISEHLRTVDAALYLKDITHTGMAARGLRCVKAVTPGLFPLWFGSRQRRVALTDRLRRLARDLCGREITELSDLNLEVHPFS